MWHLSSFSGEYDNKVYVTKNSKDSLMNIGKNSKNPDGLRESFMKSAGYHCVNGEVPWSKLDSECEVFEERNPSKRLSFNNLDPIINFNFVFLTFR